MIALDEVAAEGEHVAARNIDAAAALCGNVVAYLLSIQRNLALVDVDAAPTVAGVVALDGHAAFNTGPVRIHQIHARAVGGTVVDDTALFDRCRAFVFAEKAHEEDVQSLLTIVSLTLTLVSAAGII